MTFGCKHGVKHEGGSTNIAILKCFLVDLLPVIAVIVYNDCEFLFPLSSTSLVHSSIGSPTFNSSHFLLYVNMINYY